MMRLYISGSGCIVCGIFGAILMFVTLVVIWIAEPRHMRELDGYPADPNKDSIPEPPSSIPLDGPSQTQ